MFHPEKTGGNDWCKRIKVEEATDYSPLSAIPITNTWNSHSNSFFPSSGEKLVPSLHDPFFHETSLPATDFSVFYSGLSGISDSGCALSLLSSKSQNSSKIPMGRPLVIPPAGTSNSHHGTSQVSDKFGDVGPVPISESFSIRNRNYGGSDFGSAKGGGVSSEDGATIDLLQLSSQLQRVEHQRQSMQGEHENDAFCCLRITWTFQNEVSWFGDRSFSSICFGNVLLMLNVAARMCVYMSFKQWFAWISNFKETTKKRGNLKLGWYVLYRIVLDYTVGLSWTLKHLQKVLVLTSPSLKCLNNRKIFVLSKWCRWYLSRNLDYKTCPL